LKLQAKILLLVIPLVVVPLLAVGWIGFTNLHAFSEDLFLQQMRTLSEELSHRMQAHLYTVAANVELFCNSPTLRKYAVTTDEDERYSLLQPALLRIFGSYQRAYPDYFRIRFLLPDGSEDARLSAGPAQSGTHEESRTLHLGEMHAAQDDVYTRYLRDPARGRLVLVVAKRLVITDASVQDPVSAKPVLRGYLEVTAGLDYLEHEIETTPVGRRGFLVVTDASGVILLHPDPSRVGTRVPDRLLGETSAVTSGEPIRASFLGEPYVFVAGPAVHQDVRVFAGLPESELAAVGRALAPAVAAVILAAMLVTSGLIFAVLRHVLVNPIHKLRAAALEVGAGNLATPLTIATHDEIGELASAFREMSGNLRRSDERIRYLAYHDSLTGLPNRNLFQRLLQRALDGVQRHGHLVSLMLLDLDNFKRVNDTQGHEAGDKVLVELAERLVACVRGSDYVSRILPEDGGDAVARLGGDEFMIVLTNLTRPDEAARVCERVLEAVSRPFVLPRGDFRLGASIGIAVHPADGEDAETLMRHVDIAMYHAKAGSKNTYQFYAEAMNVAVMERVSLESALRGALDRGELLLHYQPFVALVTGKVVGVEALLRWQHPERGMIPPDRFIPLAEETGLIVPIGQWVLHAACRQSAAWQAAGLPPLAVAVNVSAVQFRQPAFHESVARALADSNLAPEHLEIEVTESVVVSHDPSVHENISAVVGLGARLAMDDFGTGYSSLSYLRRLPLHKVKIDRSFLRNVETSPRDAALVSAIIVLAHGLDLAVTAEGVETDSQYEFLRGRGCDLGQGYFIGRPISADHVPAVCRDLGLPRDRPSEQHSGQNFC
jgi:diguanylate cyclase (GGDEF)-like protein